MTERVPATTWYPLAALAERINKTSTEHGFWPTDRDDALEQVVPLSGLLPDGELWRLEKIAKFIEAQSMRNMGEMLMLATSELAEALEEHRDGNPIAEWRCKACGRGTGSIDILTLPRMYGCRLLHQCHYGDGAEEPCIDGEMKPEGILVELMDCVIRCLDTSLGVVRDAGEDNTFIDRVAEVKMRYNAGRPHKHGKAY